MSELWKKLMSGLVSITAASRRLLSKQLGTLARDQSGSVLIEYALFASGLGVTATGALSALGVDIGSLYQALDTPLCTHLALRVDCSLPF